MSVAKNDPTLIDANPKGGIRYLPAQWSAAVEQMIAGQHPLLVKRGLVVYASEIPGTGPSEANKGKTTGANLVVGPANILNMTPPKGRSYVRASDYLLWMKKFKGAKIAVANFNNKPLDLVTHRCRRCERARGSRLEEGRIGRTVPQPVRQPGGECESVGYVRYRCRIGRVEQRLGAREHCDERPAHRFLEAISLLEPGGDERHVGLDVSRRHRPAERSRHERGEQPASVVDGL